MIQKKNMYFSQAMYKNRNEFIEKPEFLDGIYINLLNNFM